MMIKTHRQYEKAWAKLSKKQQTKTLETIQLFLKAPSHPSLRLHQLKGDYYPQYSLSAGGDLRIHLLISGEDTVVLMTVGTHSQLYG